MRLLPLLFLAGLLSSCGADSPGVSYTAVSAILEKNCVSCHGAKEPESELRLDSLGGILAGGKSGPAIIPGDADSSLLISAVEDSGLVTRMPPEDDAPALDSASIRILRRWVREGARPYGRR